MAITHKYTVMCDDIRQENTGKFILIGIYMGNITVPQVPVVLPSLAFFQVFESDRPANLTFRARLERMDTGQPLVEAMGMVNIQRPGIGIAPLRFSPVQIPTFGSYNFVLNIEGEQPIISSFDVVVLTLPQSSPQLGFRQP